MYSLVLVALAAAAADTTPPTIQHTPPATAEIGKALELHAVIEDPSGVFAATAFVRSAGEVPFASYELVSANGREFKVLLPPGRMLSDLEYYLEAFDMQGNGPTRVGSSDQPLVVKLRADPVFTPPPDDDPLPLPMEPLPSAEAPPSFLGPAIVAGSGVVLAVVGAVLLAGAGSELASIDARYTPGEGRLPADAAATLAAQTRGTIGSVLVVGGAAALAGGAAWWLVPALLPPPVVAIEGAGGDAPPPGFQVRFGARF